VKALTILILIRIGGKRGNSPDRIFSFPDNRNFEAIEFSKGFIM